MPLVVKIHYYTKIKYDIDGKPFKTAKRASEAREAHLLRLKEKPVETQETAKAEPSVSKADIQKKVIDLSSAGKKAEVRDIVKAYADKVSTIPEDKLSEVWAKLTALEG